ncbi:MAG: polymer-forming cytoskeletal protein [Chloroflexi bacterium]|nr:polymer-forming cytoskeletal protein [Chloroflexota bacterium]
MFRRTRSRPMEREIDLVVGPTASLSGRVRCDGSVRLEGLYEGGSIETLGHVIVTPTARVVADIQADTVSVAGVVEGSIVARRVDLLQGGRIWGRIEVEHFLLDDGGYVNGQVVIRGEEEEPPPSAAAAPQTPSEPPAS